MTRKHNHPEWRYPQTSLHLWTVGLFFLALSGIGAWDQAMVLSGNEAYFRRQGFNDAIVAYFSNYPVVPAIFWTIAVYGMLLASLLLLMRRRLASSLGWLSAAGFACLDVITFGFMDRWAIFGPWLSLFDLSIFVLSLLLAAYCTAIVRRGVFQ